MDDSGGIRRASETEAPRLSCALIALKDYNMVSKFILMLIPVSLGAITRLSHFFSAPSYKPNGALGFQAQLSEHVQGLKTNHDSTPIIIGTSLAAGIPGIKVTSHQEDLLWLLRAFDFGDDVMASRFVPFAIHLQPDPDGLASVLHTL